MRKRILGSIAALAAGAGTSWGQPLPLGAASDPPPPAAVAPAQSPTAGPGGLFHPTPPAPVIMPPIGFGPAGDPQGLGPVGGFGPPPGPMYPNPGPYGAPTWQPAPPGDGGSTGGAPHWWTSLDYLLYFAKDQPSHFPLLTTSAPNDNGILGRSSTLVLAGGQGFSYNPVSGFRVTAGFFGDADRRWGFEGSGFLTEQRSNITDIASTPTGIPTLARPFIDSANLARAFTTQVVANPNFGQGRVVLATSSQTYSVEGNGIVNLYRSEPGAKCSFSLDFLAGYRFLQLREDFTINSSTALNIAPVTTPVFALGPFGIVTQVGTTSTPVNVPFGGLMINSPAAVLVSDSYSVVNRFNGGQVALRGELRYGMFTVSATGKLAAGNMNERLEIRGGSAFGDLTRPLSGTVPNIGSAYGGLYANAANIGTYTRDQFAVIPEANLNVGMNVSRGLTAYLGYNFLYINNVARPGDQINPIVNSATVPFSPNYGAPGRPNVAQQAIVQSDFWLQGINFGMMLRY